MALHSGGRRQRQRLQPRQMRSRPCCQLQREANQVAAARLVLLQQRHSHNSTPKCNLPRLLSLPSRLQAWQKSGTECMLRSRDQIGTPLQLRPFRLNLDGQEQMRRLTRAYSPGGYTSLRWPRSRGTRTCVALVHSGSHHTTATGLPAQAYLLNLIALYEHTRAHTRGCASWLPHLRSGQPSAGRAHLAQG